MPVRHLRLRQIEAFKAVIETGGMISAARMIHISQPAMSKLIAHLEADTGLKLFDRQKGRLAPTECGMRLYKEIERIFSGVRQVENAAEAIRREEQGRLAIGALPALPPSFIQRATTALLNRRPNVFCSVESLSSQWIVDSLVTKKLDVGVISGQVDHPSVIVESLMEQPLVCIMPLNHPLADKKQIEPLHLNHVSFVTFPADSYARHRIEEIFAAHAVKSKIALVANVATIVCEFAAAGRGVSLVHPLMVSGLEHRLVVRRFEPEIRYGFQICRSTDSRNTQLVDLFIQELRSTAAEISRSMVKKLLS